MSQETERFSSINTKRPGFGGIIWVLDQALDERVGTVTKNLHEIGTGRQAVGAILRPRLWEESRCALRFSQHFVGGSLMAERFKKCSTNERELTFSSMESAKDIYFRDDSHLEITHSESRLRI
jgi:hypothetical protein